MQGVWYSEGMQSFKHIAERTKQVAFAAYLVVGAALFFYFLALVFVSMTNEALGGNPLPILHIIGL